MWSQDFKEFVELLNRHEMSIGLLAATPWAYMAIQGIRETWELMKLRLKAT